MDIPINMYFEELYQQTRKPVGRRSLLSEDIYVNEQERNEFLQRYVKLCAEYGTPGEGKMHLAAASVTFEVREDLDHVPSADSEESLSDKGT